VSRPKYHFIDRHHFPDFCYIFSLFAELFSIFAGAFRYGRSYWFRAPGTSHLSPRLLNLQARLHNNHWKLTTFIYHHSPKLWLQHNRQDALRFGR